MNRRFFLVSIACLAMASWVAAKSPTKVIAHRGYWKTEGSAQNSLRALEKAAEVKVYGSEFDVHLTADNVLIVNHDNDIQGKHIQTSTYAELKDLKLPNGECVPTLEQYLLKAKEKANRKVRLIFELKPHETPETQPGSGSPLRGNDQSNEIGETYGIHLLQSRRLQGADSFGSQSGCVLPQW